MNAIIHKCQTCGHIRCIPGDVICRPCLINNQLRITALINRIDSVERKKRRKNILSKLAAHLVVWPTLYYMWYWFIEELVRGEIR